MAFHSPSPTRSRPRTSTMAAKASLITTPRKPTRAGNTATPASTSSPPGPVGSHPLTTGGGAPMAVAEGDTAAVNGKLYAFGGYDRTSPNWLATDHAEVFDPGTNTWSFIAAAPSPFTHGGAAGDDR